MANTLNFGNGKWGVQDGLALAYNDENNNFKPLPFDFTRNSIGTYVDRDGLIKTASNNVPRVDFLDNADGALLLEPARTNLIQYSDFTSVWTNSANITNNTVTSPQGIQNANTLLKNGAYIATSYILASGVASGQIGVFSVFAKKNTTNIVGIRLASGSGASDIRKNINLDTGEITDGAAGNQVGFISLEKEDFGNGWYRLKLKGTSSGSDNVCSLYAGEIGNTTNDGEIYIYGSQLEAGSYATSYIPTSGSTVERVAEVCGLTQRVAGTIGQTEGVIYAEIDFKITDGVSGAWAISDNTSGSRITMNTVNNTSTTFTLSVAQNYQSGSTKLTSTNVTYSQNHKVAIKYSGTTLKLFVDGIETNSITTDGFGDYDKFYIGGNQTGLGSNRRKFIESKLYNTALTDAELVILTTI